MAVLGERFEDDSLVDVPPWLERAAVLSVQPGNLAGVLSVHHAELSVLVDVALHSISIFQYFVSILCKNILTVRKYFSNQFSKGLNFYPN